MTEQNNHQEIKGDPEEMAKATQLLILGVAQSKKVKTALLVTFSVAFSFVCYVMFSDLMIDRMNSQFRSAAVKDCTKDDKVAFTAQSLNEDGSGGEYYVFCLQRDVVSTATSGLNTMLSKSGVGARAE